MADPWEAILRQQAFRKRHRVGQRLRARLLRHEAQGLAWVLIDGQELLARINQAPPPGSPLVFLIQELEPEIQLKDVTPAFQPATPLAARVAGFAASRARFEALRQSPSSASDRDGARRSRFLADLAGQPEARSAFLRAAEAAGLLAGELAAGGTGRFLWLPWLPARATEHELLLLTTPGGLTEARLGFRHHSAGRVQVRVLFKPPRAGFRFFLERLEQALAPDLARDWTDGATRAECLGLERLAAGDRGGVLAGLLGPEAARR